MLIVLVADDELAVLEVLSMALEGKGHRVLKAGDGADALRILVHQPCDVVVCAEVMPVMSGAQLAEAMRVRGWPRSGSRSCSARPRRPAAVGRGPC